MIKSMPVLPTNLLTQNVATAAGKVNENSSTSVNGKVALPAGESTEESKGAFASFFANLLGDTEVKVEGKTENKEMGKGEVLAASDKAASTAEGKIDLLLKNKDQEKNKKGEGPSLSTEKVLSQDVLKNINNLIDRKPPPDSTKEAAVGEKIAATSSNLDQLLKTLKGDKADAEITEEGINPNQNNEVKNKKGSPLDFLLKESKSSDVGSIQTDPENVSKLGLSSEDFLSHMSSSKDAKDLKNAKMDKTADLLNLDGDAFDPKIMVQKQMNQSMKAYGQKQNLLNDNIIKSPKDLANKEIKLKSSIDELKTPDMKIGADLANIKEQFIPLAQKQEGQNTQTQTQGSEKILDLSKINTSNTEEIIKKISDYIQQGQVANKDSLDLTVKHESLGQFKIQVNKPVGGNGSQMDMQITTTTSEGHDFFMKHEIGLMKNLSQAGIQLSDLRIVSESGSASFAGNDSRQSNNSQSGSQAGREFMSFEASGDSSHGADRRKELWQEARNNQQRYGA
jgi:hypothetical protein